MKASAVLLPVLIAFPHEAARAEGWGRFAELSAAGGKITTMTSIARKERLLLSFDLAGESFVEVPADVLESELDADGYSFVEVSFRDEVARRRLAAALLDVLSRS